MTAPVGEWRLVRGPTGTLRYDWVPVEQPPSPTGQPGRWHVVGADGAGPGRWEWVPATAAGEKSRRPGPRPRGRFRGRFPGRFRGRLAVGLVLVTVVGALAVRSRSDEEALTRLARAELPRTAAGAKQATGVDVSRPITASGLLAGNIAPTYPAGDADTVAVVQVGELVHTVGGELVVVVRNNTSAPVASIQVNAAGRDLGGTVVVTGAAQGSYPPVLAPGELAMAYVKFRERIRSDLDFAFTTVFSAPAEGPNGDASGQVSEVSRVGDRIVGAVNNSAGRPLRGPYAVAVFCLSASGVPTSVQYGHAGPRGELQPGSVHTFSIRVHGDPCRRYVVGSRTFHA